MVMERELKHLNSNQSLFIPVITKLNGIMKDSMRTMQKIEQTVILGHKH